MLFAASSFEEDGLLTSFAAGDKRTSKENATSIIDFFIFFLLK
jgi:hypothetical protein